MKPTKCKPWTSIDVWVAADDADDTEGQKNPQMTQEMKSMDRECFVFSKSVKSVQSADL